MSVRVAWILLGLLSVAAFAQPVEVAGPFSCDVIHCAESDCFDCDGNGIRDDCDIADCPPGDLSCADCNLNGIPDGCEPDCDGDGIPNDCQLFSCPGSELHCRDCNENGIPDACEIANCDGDQACADCNGNGWLDVCEAIPQYARPYFEPGAGNHFPEVPHPVGDAIFTFSYVGDLDEEDEYVILRIGMGDGSGWAVFHLFVDGNDECQRSVESIRFSAEELRLMRHPGGRIYFLWSLSSAAGHCSDDYLSAHLELLGSSDCNGNGIPDSCDLADGTSMDVNGTGVPDECEDDCDLDGILDADVLGATFEQTWKLPISDSGRVRETLRGLPVAGTDVALTLQASSNLGSPLAFFNILEPQLTEALTLHAFDGEQQADCTQRRFTYQVPAALFNALRTARGAFSVDLIQTEFERICPDNTVALTLSYATDRGLDCDADGVPDVCALSAGAEDCNENGVLDRCEVALPIRRAGPRWLDLETSGLDYGWSEIRDVPPSQGPAILRVHVQKSRLQAFPVYVNGIEIGEFTYSHPDHQCREVTREFVLSPDQLADALVYWDGLAVTVLVEPRVGCDDSYMWAEIELDADPGNDCNGTGRLDACEIAEGTSLDRDGDGVPDECVFVCECDADINGNQAVDIDDLSTILGNFGLTNATRAEGDVSGDGHVYWEDLARAQRFFGCICDD